MPTEDGVKTRMRALLPEFSQTLAAIQPKRHHFLHISSSSLPPLNVYPSTLNLELSITMKVPAMLGLDCHSICMCLILTAT